MAMVRSLSTLALLCALGSTSIVNAFMAPALLAGQTTRQPSMWRSPIATSTATAAAAGTMRTSSSTRRAAAISNPLSKLPWNVKREQERAARRLKQERNALHRQLGIAEDATYEEIVAATDALIAKAGTDIKAKVKVEIAKDKILQIRLNERLAGLNTATKDARAQSRYEQEG